MIDRRARIADLQSMLNMFGSDLQSNLWTAFPAVIVDYDTTKQTCSIQPQVWHHIIARQDMTDSGSGNQSPAQVAAGELVSLLPPIMLDVPIVFPRAGGFALTFPVAAGDEVLAIISCRSIDAWWALGAQSNHQPPQPTAQYRMHNLSDGFAIPGPTSQPKKLANVSTNSTQLRSEDGTDYVEVKTGHIINIHTTTANINTSGDTNITSGGKTVVNATGEVDVTSATKIVLTATTEIDLTASAIKLNGAITFNGVATGLAGAPVDFGSAGMTTTGDVVSSGHSLKTHHHDTAGVQAGASTISSGGPLP